MSIDTSKIKAGDWVQVAHGDWFDVARAVWRVDKWHTPFEGTYPEASSIRRELKALGITPDLIGGAE